MKYIGEFSNYNNQVYKVEIVTPGNNNMQVILTDTFESDACGWSSANWTIKHNNYDTHGSIQNFIECWTDDYPIGNGNFYKMVDIPKGRYTVQFNYIAYSKNGDNQGDVYFEFGGNRVKLKQTKIVDGVAEVGVFNKSFDVDAGTYFMRFGVDNNKTINWVALDNISLIYDPIVQVTLGGTPFVSEMSGSTDDLFKPVRYSTASINIVSDKYLFDIYSNKNDIHVSVSSNGVNSWIGLVEPLIFNMGYDTELEEIEIDCIDYLTSLEHLRLDDINIIANRPIMSFLELYRLIMKKYTRYNNLYYPDVFSKNLLEQKISTSNFIDDKCYIENDVVYRADKNWTFKDIIEEMNRYMSLTLVAYGDNLYLLPYLLLPKQQKNWIKYSIISDDSQVLPSNYELNEQIDVENIYDGSDLNLLPIYNKFSVKVSPNKIENIIPEFLNDEKLVNITSEQFSRYPVGRTEDRYEQVDADDGLKLDEEGSVYGDFQFLKSTDKNVEAYQYRYDVSPSINEEPVIGGNITQTEYFHSVDENAHYSRVFGRPYGGICKFRKRLKEQSNDLPYGKNTEFDEWEKYIFINESASKNMNHNSVLPMFKLKSVPITFSNKMSLKFDAEMLSTIYWRYSVDEKVYYLLDYPIERDKIQFSNIDSDNESRNKIFGWIGIQIKVGDYYFKNYTETDGFNRIGEWVTEPTISRLYFDAMQDYPTYVWNKITDNSLDTAIQEDNSGYWVKFTGLPDSFEGNIEITLYPNGEQLYALECKYNGNKKDGFKVNGTKYNGFGMGSDKSHFIKDFECELVIPRDKSVTEEDWKADTIVSNVVDSESFQDATEINLRINSDFGKTPAFSTVTDSGTYSVNTLAEPEHLAEEWICYHNATQYGEVHKVLETSIKENIYPWTVINMKDRPHFGKMMIDSYKRDYRTGLTDVTLVELTDI